jgi:hypothetical protein
MKRGRFSEEQIVESFFAVALVMLILPPRARDSFA